jgi:hypothetical protein
MTWKKTGKRTWRRLDASKWEAKARPQKVARVHVKKAFGGGYLLQLSDSAGGHRGNINWQPTKAKSKKAAAKWMKKRPEG